MDGVDLRPHRELLLVPASLGHYLWPVGMRLLAPASTHHTGPTPIADLSPLYELLPEPLINILGAPGGTLLRWQRQNTVGAAPLRKTLRAQFHTLLSRA